MTRERIVVICPGRGTYNQAEWGYLARHHADKSQLLSEFDAARVRQGQPGVRELDATIPFQLKLHSRGDHASALIYACAYCDALSIDADRHEIVAVTGNSMGWYIALAVAGALSAAAGLELVNTMGRLMQESLIGGQILYPWVDDDWQPQPERRTELLDLAARITAAGQAHCYLSIDLGGMLVFGGDAAGLARLEAALPHRDRYPLRLYNHAAFHTPLQAPVRETARQRLATLPFAAPRVPLIDGRGHVWTPYSTDPRQVWNYTLGHQLTEPYDFTRAVTVAVKEFAPDRLILLGPGTTLGGAVAQTLIRHHWRGLAGKLDFQARQREAPFLLSMGRDDQRARLATQ
ncbi:MAG: ACP S-malonyltransferase [Gammaproteobacteria bacterium]|nr:ACP S-malonyltransferase [Gammaproteobacteria bacterium]